MKITMTLTLPVDNEIQFYDVLKGAAEKLTELADTALRDGDHEQFRGTTHTVMGATDDPEKVGEIKVSR